MAEETQQDGQKTLVAFVVGLLIGGMLVWAFSGPDASAPAETSDEPEAEETTEMSEEEEGSEAMTEEASEAMTEEAPALQVGTGAVEVLNQPASASVALNSATYPVSEGWIGVRDYNNGQLGYILGVVRFSESQGLIPTEIVLQRPTTPGKEYAIVIYTEDGDFDFSLAGDVQIDEIFDTFVAE